MSSGERAIRVGETTTVERKACVNRTTLRLMRSYSVLTTHVVGGLRPGLSR